ncbi:DNA cytosine methyltransferase [Streptomyces buecherae]|uniref:DNA cytosine methyltransferase n=1 Tax=Streptomyces buecherae TaxID=2763006 RepID=UPI0036AEEC5D
MPRRCGRGDTGRLRAGLLILDLFAGAGGWSHALTVLGARDVGLEWGEAACKTRRAAGQLTVRTDVALYPTWPFVGRTRGLIASPPCQAWSMAGRRLGLVDQPLVHAAVSDLAAGRDTRERLLAACRDHRSLLAAEPMRYLHALNTVGEPEWVALEEVPAVLPLWKQYAATLRTWGFSAWCGILTAADFGVPQTRRRAILLASRVRPAQPPLPTHTRDAEPASLFGPGRDRWVSMAQALGWDRRDQSRPTTPAPALPAEAHRWSWSLRSNNQSHATVRALQEPAGTLFFGHRANQCTWVATLSPANATGTDEPALPEPVQIIAREAGILQTFPADYPWAGNKGEQFTQIGNAVPPRLAAHLLAPHLGVDFGPDDFALAA